MLEHLIHDYLPHIVSLIEIMGIFVVAISALQSFFHYLKKLVGRNDTHNIKVDLGRGMATGLEFKMAAEILKTVLVRDMSELVVLGAVIILRALLAFMIHFEIKHDVDI